MTNTQTLLVDKAIQDLFATGHTSIHIEDNKSALGSQQLIDRITKRLMIEHGIKATWMRFNKNKTTLSLSPLDFKLIQQIKNQ